MLIRVAVLISHWLLLIIHFCMLGSNNMCPFFKILHFYAVSFIEMMGQAVGICIWILDALLNDILVVYIKCIYRVKMELEL